jgi:two-component system, LytTR family, response regulator
MVALIVEDDPNSREILRAMLASGHPELKEVHHASNVKDAMVAIETYRPAVIFLDVELPDGTGFDLLGQGRIP